MTLLAGLVGCQSVQPSSVPSSLSAAAATLTAPAEVHSLPLWPQQCSGRFVAHDLDHTTAVPGASVDMFESNGTGVAINDLDNDGLLDIVLANHAAPNTILWNQGQLRFKAEQLAHGGARAVHSVDVDADGRLDIVFTRGLSGPNVWRNTGDPRQRWEPLLLPGVAKPAFVMAWGDTDQDGDLDLVTGAYDAELLAQSGASFLLSDGAGVYTYEQHANGWRPTRLASKAQALAVALIDLNADGARDLLIGNDFAAPDQAWLRHGTAWLTTVPFRQISHSTMSFDWADVNNDGRFELFATDMKSYKRDAATLAQWAPMMDRMWHPPIANDPQTMENTLQVQQADGTYRNEAYQRGVDATGWSWSGKFGDLDNDGAIDLYVANGMIESDLIAYLPNHELVEQNQALRNTGQGWFERAPHWQLGSTRSGRGMSIADLDGDTDLDIVVNNVRAPAQLFENQLCTGSGLELELRWPRSHNTRAIGATVALHTSAGQQIRDVRSGSGYLSGDPSRLHFGVPRDVQLRQLEIVWPDGAATLIEPPQTNTLLTITRLPQSEAAVNR